MSFFVSCLKFIILCWAQDFSGLNAVFLQKWKLWIYCPSCVEFFSRERECEVNFIICFWTFEINNSWTSETADAHSFFGTGIFLGGRQGCIFYLAYKTSDASWPLSFSAKWFAERQSWVTWDQVGNYSNNFEIILPETHF